MNPHWSSFPWTVGGNWYYSSHLPETHFSLTFQDPTSSGFLAPIVTLLMSSHPPRSQTVQRALNPSLQDTPRPCTSPSNCFPGFLKQISPASVPTKYPPSPKLPSKVHCMPSCFHKRPTLVFVFTNRKLSGFSLIKKKKKKAKSNKKEIQHLFCGVIIEASWGIS